MIIVVNLYAARVAYKRLTLSWGPPLPSEGISKPNVIKYKVSSCHVSNTFSWQTTNT